MNTKEKEKKTEVSLKKKASSPDPSDKVKKFFEKRMEENYDILKSRTTRKCDFPDCPSLKAGPYNHKTKIKDEFITDGILMLTVHKISLVIAPHQYKLEGKTLYCPGQFRLRPLPYPKNPDWREMYRILCSKTLDGSISGFFYDKRIPVRVNDDFSFRLKIHFIIILSGGGLVYVNRYRKENERYFFRRRLFFEFNRRNILMVKPSKLEQVIHEYDRRERKKGIMADDKCFIR